MRLGRLTIAIASAVVMLAASPAVYLFVRAGDVRDALDLGRVVVLLARTLALALAVSLAALVIGVPLAYWTTRCAMPWRRSLVVLLALPLAIPSYLFALTAIAFGGPAGVLAETLAPVLEIRPPVASGFVAAAIVLTLSTYPLVFLTVRGALLRADASLIEASRTLGVPHRETVRRIVWPSIRPAAVSGAILVGLYVIHDFGAVTLLRVDTFTRSIFVAYQGSFDRQRAAGLAVVLMLVALVVGFAGARARGRTAVARVHASAPRAVPPLELSRWARRGVVAACLAVVLAAVVMPVAVLLHLLARSSRAVALGPSFEATGASVFLGLVATVVIVVAATPVARVLSISRGRIGAAFEALGSVGYALPGLVVALALVFLATRLFPFVYQTMPLLIVAYLVLFLPQATGPIRAAFEHLPRALIEAGRTLGASPARTARTIVAPLALPGIAAGAALVFLTILKELPATIILSPPGFRSLAMRVYDASLAARYDEAALPALIILAVSSIPLAGLLIRRTEGVS